MGSSNEFGIWKVFKIAMLVVVKGNPLVSSSKLVGLDILSPRHPKLYSLIVSRLGLQTDPAEQVVLLNGHGELDSTCQPDNSGRQRLGASLSLGRVGVVTRAMWSGACLN